MMKDKYPLGVWEMYDKVKNLPIIDIIDECFKKWWKSPINEETIEENGEIEIIEDTPEEDNKILEKLQTYEDDNYEIYFDDCYRYIPIHKDSLSYNEEVIVDKINEIIDKVNGDKNE